MNRSFLKRMMALTLPLLLAACVGGGSPGVRHFLIAPMVEENISETLLRPLEVAVEPVVIPSYLNRPQIVQRTGANEFALSDAYYWVEKLSDNLTRVLAENLGGMLTSATVQVLPVTRKTAFDARVAVEVIAFESEVGKEVRLKARWRLYDGEGVLLLTQLSNIAVVSEPDMPSVVQAMSRAYSQFCREVATEIRLRSGKKKR